MNYEQAVAELTSRRAMPGVLLSHKTLGRATALVHPSSGGIGLELFGRTILTWFPDGRIKLDTGGFTRKARDRFKRYLPSGFSIVRERPYWFVRTPSGTRPFSNGMILDAKGRQPIADSLVPPEIDALDLKERVHQYSIEYVHRLMRGNVYLAGDCADCVECVASPPPIRSLIRWIVPPTHVLHHLGIWTGVPSYPAKLLRYAADDNCSGFYRYATRRHLVEGLWGENQIAWRAARHRRDLIKQTEVRMLNPHLPQQWRSDWGHARRELRLVLERYILNRCFGFEELESHPEL